MNFISRRLSRCTLRSIAMIGCASLWLLSTPTLWSREKIAASHPVKIWAKTADGKIVNAVSANRPPWYTDAVKVVGFEYPYWDRALHHQGTGMFHVSIDPRTGLLTKIEIVKSTGFKSLDGVAVKTLHHWRWKPGKWKEFAIPVTFVVTKKLMPAPPGTINLPGPGKSGPGGIF